MRYRAAAATAVLCLVQSIAWAGPEWLEDKDGGGDAGRLPDDAQVTEGEGELLKISGTLEGTPLVGLGDIEDMYLIRILQPELFSSSTDLPEGGFADFDTQLWLFGPLNQCPSDTNGDGVTDVIDLIAVITGWGTDGSGNNSDVIIDGIVDVADLVAVIVNWGPCPDPEGTTQVLGLLGNDDTPNGGSTQSLLLPEATDGTGAAVTQPGLYYLAVTPFNDDPLSAGGAIFDQQIFTEISGPDGPGGALPVIDWDQNTPSTGGTYEIALTGVGFAVPISSELIVITQSESKEVVPGNSVSCNAGGFHTNNSYFRAFHFEDAGVYPPFHIEEVEIGIEDAQGELGDQPVVVRIYDTPDITEVIKLSPVFSQTYDVVNQNLTLETFDVSASPVLNSYGFVIEIFTPDGQKVGNSFFIGSNGFGESAPSYLLAPDCGIFVPTTTGDIGFPNMHIVMNVIGTVGADVCGPGAGDCFDLKGNGTPGCEDPKCCDVVCSSVPFCCDTQWDGSCASLAAEVCLAGTEACCLLDGTCLDLVPDDCLSSGGSPQSPNSDCQTAKCPITCGVGAGDCFDPGGNGTPGCDDVDCCTTVCYSDSFCCDTEWDAICASAALRLCSF